METPSGFYFKVNTRPDTLFTPNLKIVIFAL